MTEMKREKKPRKTTKQNRDNQPIRCRVQNTGDQDVHRTHWVWQQNEKIQGEIKITLNDIKKNLQGTNSGGDEAGIQISDLKHKEEISIQPEPEEEKRTQNNEDSIRYLWDISKHTNIWIIWMPEGEEEEQEIENLFEKIMKENFPNLVKEIDIQVQEVQRIPNKLDPKRIAPRHIIIKIPNYAFN